ncbi:zinc finger E-box-binding homeobox protein zag-1-like [Contarinia nasturtii]|uniref:zinc finger E-box-binding homeobox protein zag-1-like n=1 Tax=Contarinia nasturtii TaxID=265458 RepID=UPI0012D3A3C7|nr:zinc finger E-box-binding homeobox protein zag-1-like [Contarinia nasturtii]
MVRESQAARNPLLRTLVETNGIASFGNAPIADQRIKIECSSPINSSIGNRYRDPFILDNFILASDDSSVVESTEIASNERKTETRNEGAKMDASAMDWRNEMNNMLAAFDRQTTMSLGKIKTAFELSGLLFNAEFKQYFLRVSNDRIKNTYDQFEIYSMLKDRVNGGPDANMSMAVKFGSAGLTHSMGDAQNENNSPVEINGSSDEEDQIKTEPFDAGFGIQCDNNDEMFDWNNFSNTNLRGIEDGDDTDDDKNDKATKVADKEMDDGISTFVDHLDTTNEQATLNNGRSILGGARSFKKGGRLIGCPRKDAKSRLNPESFRNKTSTSSNQMETNKRFKCRLCKYSSNQKGHFNRHMRTHSGEKPYRCDICRKEFTCMQNLKKHKITHINEFPFHCRGCLDGFFQKADKEAHEKVCKMR